MPTDCSADRFEFAPVEGRAVVAGFDGGTITSDAGALLLGATDRAIGLVRRFTACFVDHRAAAQVEHSLATLVGQRVFALALGYEDLLDHDTLRHDPVLAATLGKLTASRADCAPLAGKSTLNRLEHAPAGEATRYPCAGVAGVRHQPTAGPGNQTDQSQERQRRDHPFDHGGLGRSAQPKRNCYKHDRASLSPWASVRVWRGLQARSWAETAVRVCAIRHAPIHARPALRKPEARARTSSAYGREIGDPSIEEGAISPSHGENRGSGPLGDAIKSSC